jgi:hypothetical protein
VNTGNSQAYVLAATAPNDIQAGHTYYVYVSNAYNGNTNSGGETRAGMTLQGRASGNDYWQLKVPWAADLNFTHNVYNVQTDGRLQQHARGDGSAGDRGAIGEAIADAARDGGGIVYLPAGTYNLYFQNGCGIALFHRVVLMGAGANNTFVQWGFGPPPGIGTGYAVCFAQSQSGVSDITFNNVNQYGNWPESAIGTNANELFLQRTNWNVATAQWLVLTQNTNVTMQNSTIVQGLDTSYNGPINASYSTNWTFRNNTVKYVGGSLQFDGISGAIFENNTVIRDASISTPSWVITHVMAGNWAQHFMMLNNTFEVQGGTLPRKNDGEVAGSEAGGSLRRDEFRGTVQYAGSNSITDYSQNFNWSPNNAIPNLRVGATLAIVSGKGAGQWATVSNVSADGHIVWIDHNWAVMPASGSHYATFDWSSLDWIIAGNTLNDNEKGIEFFDASIRDILISGNRMTNDGQILISPSEQPDGAGMFNLALNAQITSNTVVDNNNQRPAAISVVAREDRDHSNFGTSVIGAEVRGNSVTGHVPNTFYSDTRLDDSKALSEGINIYWQWQTVADFQDNGTPSVLGTVVQSNSLTNSAAAFVLNTGDYHTVLVSNSTNNVDCVREDQAIMGAMHASVDTVTATSDPKIPIAPKTPISGAPGANSWSQLTVGSLASSVLSPALGTATSFLLPASVTQFEGIQDAFSMLARLHTGDTEFMARISIPSAASSSSQGSVVFRASPSSGDPFVSAGVNREGQFFAQYRLTRGGSVSTWQMPVSNGSSPVWVRLGKSGNVFRMAYSLDGIKWSDWTQLVAAFDSSTFIAGLENASNQTTDASIFFERVSLP